MNSRSHYAVLGVRRGASPADIRAAYKKLAMKWHPDRWSKDGAMTEEAKRRFQEIQQAYQVLSHERRRALYDMGLYDDGETEEEVEGFAGFMEEMSGLMADVRREGRSYSLVELWGMLQDMAGGGGPAAPPWVDPPCHAGERRRGKKSRVGSGDMFRMAADLPCMA